MSDVSGFHCGRLGDDRVTAVALALDKDAMMMIIMIMMMIIIMPGGPPGHWQMADDDRDSGTMIMIRMTHRGSDHWHRMISCFGTRLSRLRESESDSESDIRVDSSYPSMMV